MRKPALAFYYLCILKLFSEIVLLIGHNCAGVSNKHCILPFFIFPCLRTKKLPKRPKLKKCGSGLNFLRFSKDHTEDKHIVTKMLFKLDININKIYKIYKKKNFFSCAVIYLLKTSVTPPNFGQVPFSLFWQPLPVTIATINVKST